MMKTEMYCYLENREKKPLPSRMDEWLDPRPHGRSLHRHAPRPSRHGAGRHVPGASRARRHRRAQ